MKKIIIKLFITFFAILCFRETNAQIITTIAGTHIAGYSGDGGPATDAKIRQFGGIFANDLGYIYIADGANNRIRVINDLTGIINTIAGIGIAGYNGDGIPATSAQLNLPVEAISDNFGNLIIVDGNNFRIRKVNAITGIISTIAGNGIFGSTGDGGAATSAEIYGGWITIDCIGNLYICDNHKIRKIDTTGLINTIAGTGLAGITDDGVPATSTNINPEGISTDSLGNIYFSDTTHSIRKINISTGIINRVAGTGDNLDAPYLDNVPATSSHIGPLGIAVDKYGNIYIADHGNSRIERIDVSTGIIHCIAGTGTIGYTGDGGPATDCELYNSEGVAIDGCGDVYIADEWNYVARKITYPPVLTIPTITIIGESSMPIGSTVTLTATITNAGSSYIIYWMNHGIEFTTTTVPIVTYIKPPGIDTITARVVPTGYGCWDSTTSAGYMVHVNTEDIRPLTTKGEPSIWPNPVKDVLNIYNGAALIENVTVSNLLGQTMLSNEFGVNQVQLNVTALTGGVYFVKVNGVYVGKFVKQ